MSSRMVYDCDGDDCYCSDEGRDGNVNILSACIDLKGCGIAFKCDEHYCESCLLTMLDDAIVDGLITRSHIGIWEKIINEEIEDCSKKDFRAALNEVQK